MDETEYCMPVYGEITPRDLFSSLTEAEYCQTFFVKIQLWRGARCRLEAKNILFTGAALYALSSELLISNKFWD